jgi:prepilin-type processing-associated H-X9-DG protein
MSKVVAHDPEWVVPISKATRGRHHRLIERLIVMAIIAVVIPIMTVLVTFLFAAVEGFGRTAYRAQCTNNFKQISLAILNYEDAYHALPPAYTVDAGGRPLHSWRTLILPYLEQQDLYATIDLSKPWNDPANARALATPIDTYRCPLSRAPANSTSYLATVADNGCLLPTRPRALADIKDNHYSTLMLIEASDEKSPPWMAPTDADEDLVLRLGSPKANFHHPGGMNAGFVDGSAHSLKANTKPDVLRALFSISGGEITEFADY